MTQIEFDSYSPVRRWRAALKPMSLTVTDGVSVILGPNGAGKSTLLSALGTLAIPHRGGVRFGGEPLVARNRRQLARAVGYLPQSVAPIVGFSAFEAVRYAAWLKGMTEKQSAIAATSALAALNLGEVAHLSVRKLSGGMQRRVGLAQAVVHGPKFLLLDEPSVGLDPEQAAAFRKLVASSRAEVTILSTHQLNDVLELADNLIVLREGTVVFHGSLDEFVATAGGRRDQSSLEDAYGRLMANETA